MHGPLGFMGFMAATIMILGYTHPCWSVMQTDLMHANSVAQIKEVHMTEYSVHAVNILCYCSFCSACQGCSRAKPVALPSATIIL